MARRFRSLACRLLLTTAACGWFGGEPAAAYTPDSPEVKRAVAKAATYLETAKDGRLGARALAGRVMLYLGKPDHPCVKDAVTAVRHEIEGIGGIDEESRVYSLGIGLAFMSELNDPELREDLQQLVDMVLARQKPNGAWGYPSRETGDTSMTQYAIYGLWNAAQVGIAIDRDVWSRAIRWLLQTQDPSGGWGYQGIVPNDGTPVQQQEVRRSLTEGALASLYLGGERFGVWRFRREDPSVSPLLKKVEVKRPAADALPFDVSRYRTALDGGNRWDRNSTEPISLGFPCYHLYTIERYHSFREAALGTADAPAWYDVGVEYLLKSQLPDGGWKMPEGPVAGTAFAALFLMRTTRTAILKIDTIGAGTLIGGRGLPIGPQPTPTATAAPPHATNVPRAADDLAALTKKLQDPAFMAAMADAERRGPLADAPPPNELKQRLVALAKGDSPAAQAAALAALGRTGDLDHVPLLIEAVRDPNPAVHQAAVDALRYLARRTDEFGKPLPTDAASRQAEATRWQEWYRTIRPPGR